MIEIKQSTSRPCSFVTCDAAGDPVTGLVDGDWTKSIGKAGANAGAMTVTITEDSNGKGRYLYTLGTGHTDTLGELALIFEAAGVLNVNHYYEITARVTDDLATSSALATAQTSIDDIPTNAELTTALSGVATSAAVADLPTNAELATALSPLALSTEVDTVEATLATLTTSVADLPTNAELATALTPIALEATLGTLATAVADLPTNAELATALDPIPTAAENADAVCDELLSGHVISGSVGAGIAAAAAAVAPSAATVAAAVWDKSRASHVTAGTFGQGVVVNSLATESITHAATAPDFRSGVAAAVWAYAHEAGRTTLGVMRRIDAFLTGKATGLRGVLATFFRPDGVTAAIQATQDPTLGTRETASTVGGD